MSRGFIFTKFDYGTDFLTILKAFKKVEYIYAGEEVCPTTARPHLQGYIEFTNKRSLQALRAKLGCHVEARQGTKFQAYTYAAKEGNCFYEFGSPPQENDPEAEANVWTQAWESAKRGAWEEIRADIRIRYHGALQRIYIMHRTPSVPLPWNAQLKTGLLLHGAPGTGKTRYCWDNYPGHFVKAKNHWWDWYADEEIVCLQDITPKFVKDHIDLILEWTDIYPFAAEFKGGSFRGGIRPTLFVFTSNYTMEQLLADIADESQAAILRRFAVQEMGAEPVDALDQFFNN